jgi:hypothetical protein
LNQDPLLKKVFTQMTTHTTIGNFHLQVGSPAIDAGNQDLLPPDWTDAECQDSIGSRLGNGNATEVVTIDFDGHPRVIDGNRDGVAVVDLGAYEAPANSVPDYPLTVTKTGTGQGTVNSNKAGITCGDDCTESYPQGLTLALVATAKAGSTFTGWSGACSGTKEAAFVEMTEARRCEARFERLPPTPVTPITTDTPPSTVTPPVAAPPVVIPPPVVISANFSCPTTGNINDICNYGGREVTNLGVQGSGMVSNGVVSTTVVNHGWVSNFTITATGKLSGGIVTGYIKNEGVMRDFEFRGASILGGTLGGKIINTSKIGGYFQDVTLLADTQILGGILKGKIRGDQKSPALLENVRIRQGSHLSGVKLGKNVKLEKGVVVE